MSDNKKAPAEKRVRDIAFEVVIGLAIVAAVILYAIYVPANRMPQVRWLGLAGITPVTFAYPLRWYRRYQHHALFWAAFIGLLLLHLCAYTVLLLNIERWELMWFVIINPLEWLVICPVLELAGKYAEKGGSLNGLFFHRLLQPA